ncbi:MAG: SIMPL domain-containing protein [Gemmatimonadota bacterium]|nr:SIMPL domain-containing protein [Gemmatimonadota bacterium]
MKRMIEVAAVAVMLSACAGPPAGGQAAPGDPGDLGRLNVYEVPSERLVAPLQEAPSEGWIDVTGEGSVDVTPDRASVSFAVETRGRDAGSASATNADAMDAVMTAIRAARLPGAEIETFGYSLSPEYAANNNQRTREIIAYVSVNYVRTTISDIDQVGRVIDTAVGAGANRVTGISFFASDTDEAEAEALADAVRNATAKARVIATALGYELGPPMEVNGGSRRPVPFEQGMVMARSLAQAAPTPIEAGDQTVTASVSIRFALGRESGG